ncbi:MAG: hypothetical protein SFV17_18845 [Candidatus Obscuribacter sp.]|nr:hypothetical protein [Candidatus Obscuribacter sp.]
MKHKLLKVTISALAGFLISASLVVVPGTLFMVPSKRPGAAQMILGLNMSLQERYWATGVKSPKLLQDLMWQGFLLSLAQNQVDCLPFLFLGASLGPLLIWFKSQGSDKSKLSVKVPK